MYDSMREMYLMIYIIRLYYKKILNDTHEDIAKVVSTALQYCPFVAVQSNPI